MAWLKIFHGFISSRLRSNAIISIYVNGLQVDGVRGLVYNHFTTHFQEGNNDRSGVENLNFNYLNRSQCAGLIKLFSLEEVKQMGWDSDSFKNSGLNGINFGFLKDLCEEIELLFYAFSIRISSE